MQSFNASRGLKRKRQTSLRRTQRERIFRFTTRRQGEFESDEEIVQNHSPSNKDEVREIYIDNSTTSKNYVDDDFDRNDLYPTKDFLENDSSFLFNGSNRSLQSVARDLIALCVSANIDKRTCGRLLVFIKNLLPQPNKLPKTWNKLTKIVGSSAKTITSFFCGQCHDM